MFKDWGETIKGCLQGGSNEVATLSCLPVVFANLLNALLIFAGLIAFMMFAVGGFKIINSAEDPKKHEGARKNFIYGILGLAIVFFSFLIINLIYAITGVECIKNGFFGFGCK